MSSYSFIYIGGYNVLSNHEIPLKKKSIVFIGFMGVGKTTIGELIANKLDRDFIDTDVEIEKEYQMPITQIFNTLGEEHFRKKEKEFITKLCQERFHVISLGGGAFLQEEIRNVCMDNCIVIYLHLPWDSWKNRFPLIIESRPVLQGKSMGEIEEIFNKRQEVYSKNHFKIECEHLSAEEISTKILESLKNIKG
ncbi:shikimate kinase [Cytobacillus dafuensis]|uniref:Shikimate kinase n=1 Tax=Cytobacillus dafuensis TaxID=1742359 RepID=A0A5B8ZAX0_CYTDA|nr:shikimate kinase [Cytobacillus dafuensis]QED48769.1 shikimate kinase [Cytobacillus dafuensis]